MISALARATPSRPDWPRKGTTRSVQKTAGLAADPSRALALATDISDPGQVEEAFAKTVKTFGRLDLLFNNAGAGTPAKPIDENTLDEMASYRAQGLTFAPEAGTQRMREGVETNFDSARLVEKIQPEIPGAGGGETIQVG